MGQLKQSDGAQLSMAQANDEVWRLARQATEAAGTPLGGGAAENGSRERVEPYDRLGTPSLPMGQLKALHSTSPTDNPLADVRSCRQVEPWINPWSEPTHMCSSRLSSGISLVASHLAIREYAGLAVRKRSRAVWLAVATASILYTMLLGMLQQ